MLYNLYISTFAGKYNIFGLSIEKLQKVITAYLNGEDHVTLSGTKRTITDTSSLRIFQHDLERTPEEDSQYYLGNVNFRGRGLGHFYLPPSTLLMMGKEVTETFIQDKQYGELIKKSATNIIPTENGNYISLERLTDLKKLSTTTFDFTKLVRLCEELNDNYSKKNYLSVGMIGRTILHHIPPIFGFKSFDEIANNYGGPKDHKSFKKNMTHLNESLKNIADGYLHLQIRNKEVLPTETQIDFKQDLDVLLGEIIRIS